MEKEKPKKVYAKGIMCFAPSQGAPDYVVGNVIFYVDDLIEWLKAAETKQYITEYKGKKQIRFNLTTYERKPDFTVNTYKKE